MLGEQRMCVPRGIKNVPWRMRAWQVDSLGGKTNFKMCQNRESSVAMFKIEVFNVFQTWIWAFQIYLSQKSPSKGNPNLKTKTSLEVLNIPYVTSSLGIVLPNNQLKCKKWLGSLKNDISKLGPFKLLGWLANPVLIYIIFKQTESRISRKFRQTCN